MKNIFKNFLKNLNDETCKKTLKRKFYCQYIHIIGLTIPPQNIGYFFFTSAILQIKNK